MCCSSSALCMQCVSNLMPRCAISIKLDADLHSKQAYSAADILQAVLHADSCRCWTSSAALGKAADCNMHAARLGELSQ